MLCSRLLLPATLPDGSATLIRVGGNVGINEFSRNIGAPKTSGLVEVVSGNE